MVRKLVVSFFITVFFAGLSLMLFLLISNRMSASDHVEAVSGFFEAVEDMGEPGQADMLQEAREFNQRLSQKPNRFMMNDDEMAEYKSLLDPTGLGIIGTLDIGIISIHLPIFHGTDEGVLQAGLGHLEGSSLPVGGVGSHAVITGHRGLPTSTLLSKLDSMAVGDTFTIHIPGDTLIYKVDQMLIVEPHETAALAIDSGEDYVTLVTCTPYGINTHRLLVRGYRVTGDEEILSKPAVIPAGALVLPGAISALLVIIPMALIIVAVLFVRLRRIYARGES